MNLSNSLKNAKTGRHLQYYVVVFETHWHGELLIYIQIIWLLGKTTQKIELEPPKSATTLRSAKMLSSIWIRRIYISWNRVDRKLFNLIPLSKKRLLVLTLTYSQKRATKLLNYSFLKSLGIAQGRGEARSTPVLSSVLAEKWYKWTAKIQSNWGTMFIAMQSISWSFAKHWSSKSQKLILWKFLISSWF